MKFSILLLTALLGACVAATAQVEFTSGNFFPADQEFRELQKVISEESFDDPARLSKVEDGKLVLDVGFDRYMRRTYSLSGSGQISVEVIALKDSRAAFSLLTLLRTSPIQDGPPGDAVTAAPGIIRFCEDRYWIRIRGQGSPDELLKRIAVSVGNRIGFPPQKPPALISHLPQTGYNASSLRYFPGLASFETYSRSSEAKLLHFPSDVEIAQSDYGVGNQRGVLLLLNFPTGQVAEDYFDALGSVELPDKNGGALYTRRAGPIVAILKGPIDSLSADKFLSSLRYSYSIRWIYERKNQSKIIWGIPVSILGTVVRSLFFIAILAVISIVAGAVFAFLRFSLRQRLSPNAQDAQDQDNITRLRLR